MFGRLGVMQSHYCGCIASWLYNLWGQQDELNCVVAMCINKEGRMMKVVRGRTQNGERGWRRGYDYN